MTVKDSSRRSRLAFNTAPVSSRAEAVGADDTSEEFQAILAELDNLWPELASSSSCCASKRDSAAVQPVKLLPSLGDFNVRFNPLLTNFQNVSPLSSGRFQLSDPIIRSRSPSSKENTFISSSTLTELSKKFDLRAIGIKIPPGKENTTLYSFANSRNSPSNIISSKRRTTNSIPSMKESSSRPDPQQSTRRFSGGKGTFPDKSFARSQSCELDADLNIKSKLPHENSKETLYRRSCIGTYEPKI